MTRNALIPLLLGWFSVDARRWSVWTYAIVGAVWFGAASFIDLSWSQVASSSLTPVWALASGLASGFVLGGVVGLTLRGLGRLPVWVRVLFWILVGCSVAVYLIYVLDALAKLQGKDARLAWIALALSGGAGAAWAALGLGIQPSPSHPRGVLASPRWGYRLVFGVMCLGIAAACVWADRTLFQETYPQAHRALRWTALFFVFGASGIGLPTFRFVTRRWLAVCAVAIVLVGLVPLFGLRSHHRAELHALSVPPFTSHALHFLRDLSDVDRDGYSALLGGGDCSPFNPNVHPAAVEVPNNGIDDNCVGGDYTGTQAGSATEHVPVPDEPSPVSVVLITVDTLRPDRLGAYGGKRPTSPELDAWAKTVLQFDRAYTSGGWTSIALSSMFRGVYPRRLHWTWALETNRWRLIRLSEQDQLRPNERPHKAFPVPIDEPRPTLVDFLKRRGMRTVAVVDDGFSRFLEPAIGVAPKFDRFTLVDQLPPGWRDDRGTTREALRELSEMPEDGAFFLWVHYFGPHGPTTHHADIPKFGKGNMAEYDHEVRYLDKHLGRLLRELKQLGEKRRLLVILTADHGEWITKRSRIHGMNLAEDSIRIPLFIDGPGFRPGRTKVLASLVDIMPTILVATKTPGPGYLDGVNLMDLVSLEDPQRTILFDTWSFGKNRETQLDLIGATDGRYKMIWNRKDEGRELYDLSRRGRRRKENLIDTVRAPELEAALTTYVQQCGGFGIHD